MLFREFSKILTVFASRGKDVSRLGDLGLQDVIVLAIGIPFLDLGC